MKRLKNVTNKEKVDALLETIVHNDDAIDYIQNQIYATENVLGYMPEDKEARKRLQIEKFIKFNLEYLNTQYKECLKRFGVIV